MLTTISQKPNITQKTPTRVTGASEAETLYTNNSRAVASQLLQTSESPNTTMHYIDVPISQQAHGLPGEAIDLNNCGGWGKAPLHKRLSRAAIGHAAGAMLVLSRKEDEDIIIGDEIAIRVQEIRGNNVSIGINAPIDIPVIRARLLTTSETEPNSNLTEETTASKPEPKKPNDIDSDNFLVLSRKKDEKIIIGDNIVITIVDIRGDKVRGDKVRLGIDAPRDVSVHRREVYDAIKRQEAEDATRPDKTNELDD
jgi:carbon storage regulator